MANWELERRWEITRYLVYYLVENLVLPELVAGMDIVDFSTGLGDLSLYMAGHSPKSIVATAPDDSPPPELLVANSLIRFRPKVPASLIAQAFEPASVDLFVARMVFQFPTEEEHRIDVDGMLAQIYEVLRPGGRLIIASHQYTEMDPELESQWPEPLEVYFDKLLSEHSGSHRAYLEGMMELITTIGIPPREGSHGQTGFGLKASMAVDSFVQCGFEIERSVEIEDFTFPVGLSKELGEKPEYYASLAQKVFEIKQRHILSKEYADKYSRPSVLGKLLQEIQDLHPFVTIPIFTIQARKA